MLARRLILGFALIWSLVGTCTSAAEISDLNAPVPGLSGKTWVDVVKRIVPDAEPTQDTFIKMTGHKGIELRVLGGGEYKPEWDDTIKITGILAEPVVISGRKRLIVSLRVQSDGMMGVVPLVLMEGEKEGRVLDALDVAEDRHTVFEEPMTRSLGVDGVLIVVRGLHGNSNQSYDIRFLVMAGPEKFASIGSVFAFGDVTCSQRMTQSVSIETKPATPFAEIHASVARKTSKLRRSDCETVIGKPKTDVIRSRFKWDPARKSYVGDAKALDRLAKENEKRF